MCDGENGLADAPDYDERLAAAFEIALELDETPDLYGELVEALAEFQALATLEPFRPEPMLGAAICEAALGRSEKALASLKACWALGFGDARFPGFAFQREDDEEIETVDLGPGQARMLQAELHFELGDVAAAEAMADRLDGAIDVEYEAHVHTLKGLCRLAADDVEGAQRNLGEALAWDRNFPPAHFLRGRLWEARREPAKALGTYDRAVRLDPDEPQFRLARARLRLETGAAGASQDLEAIDRQVAAGYGGAWVIAAAAELKNRR